MVRPGLPAEDAARIHLHDTTMDVLLAEGQTLWVAQAHALQAVVEEDRRQQAAGSTTVAIQPGEVLVRGERVEA